MTTQTNARPWYDMQERTPEGWRTHRAYRRPESALTLLRRTAATYPTGTYRVCHLDATGALIVDAMRG